MAKSLPIILIFFCLLSVVFFTYLYVTTPHAYTLVAESDDYSTVLADVEQSMQKDVIELPTLAKPFFDLWDINNAYKRIVAMQKYMGKADKSLNESFFLEDLAKLKQDVQYYNRELQEGYQGFVSNIIGMISMSLLLFIAAIMIYKKIWLKCNVAIILISILYVENFHYTSFYILDPTHYIDNPNLHNFPWMALIFLCTVAIIFFRGRDCPDELDNQAYIELQQALKNEPEIDLIQNDPVVHHEKVYQQEELDKYEEFLLYDGARFVYYFVAALLFLTVGGIPVSLWMLFRVKSMKISVLTDQIIVKGFTTKHFFVKEITDFAVLQSDSDGDAVGIEGQALPDHNLVASFFIFLFSMMLLVARGGDTYILIKNNNNKTTRFRVSSYRAEDIFIAKLENMMGKKAVRINDKMVKEWMK